MLKRLIVGLFLGTVIGAIVAAVLVQGLGVMSFDASSLGAVSAYLAAALTGVLTGLVAGKPIWSQDGKIEAGLKAFFGALLALGGMFVLRKWGDGFTPDLSALKASHGPAPIGELPAASLPLISAVLGGFFELDNSGDKEAEKKEDSTDGKATSKKVRVVDEAARGVEDEEAEDVAPGAREKKRRS